MKRWQGFTLIELLLVMALIAILAAIVYPEVGKSIEKAREASLKEDLYVLRKAIDDFYADTHQYPASLDVLVERRYLKSIPHDPVSDQPWDVVQDENGGGVRDVKSRSPGIARDGKPFHDW